MRRILPLAIGLAMAAGAAGALNKYVAIGDSIMAGSTWPVTCSICPVVFDCVAGCSATSAGRENCGFVPRLQTWLGSGNDVRNRGVGGQGTAAAVSLFDGEMDAECGTPGECIAVILMHGTNDMVNVSLETVRDNLALMIDKAKSRNIDTLLMTIIRKGLDPNNATWLAYRNLVFDLAGTKNLQLVDPHVPLCPNTTCYNLNYWIDPHTQCVGGDPNPGHVDPDGYEIMTDLVKDKFPGSVPLAPVPTSPTGDITDTTPDFVWPEVATARWYELDVDGATTWWEAAVHCPLGICTANPGVSLAPGAHAWRVRGRNLRGMGFWSADTDFANVECADPTQKDLAEFQPTPVTTTEVVDHCGPLTGAALAPYTIDTGGDLTVHTLEGFTAFDGFTVKGALTVRSP